MGGEERGARGAWKEGAARARSCSPDGREGDGDGWVRVWTFGGNDHGQLGRGRFAAGGWEPKVVAVLPAPIRALSCGARHVVLIDGRGEAYGWGDNRQGQLGPPPPGSSDAWSRVWVPTPLRLGPARSVSTPPNDSASQSRPPSESSRPTATGLAGFDHQLSGFDHELSDTPRLACGGAQTLLLLPRAVLSPEGFGLQSPQAAVLSEVRVFGAFRPPCQERRGSKGAGQPRRAPSGEAGQAGGSRGEVVARGVEAKATFLAAGRAFCLLVSPPSGTVL